ncbi:hypothetical protein V6N13_053398 [Hibiscus sabdariffa]
MKVEERRRTSNWSKIWSLRVPQRVRVFMWIAAHRRHLTNVEHVHRHIASSDKCNLCHSGPEDIYHVLRYCVKVHELWGCLLGQEAANQCATLPFDEWLHGNISISLVATAGGVDWSCQVCREQNGVADKLARLGQQYTQHGRIFVVPPGSVVVVVAEEYQYWEEQREAGASRF